DTRDVCPVAVNATGVIAGAPGAAGHEVARLDLPVIISDGVDGVVEHQVLRIDPFVGHGHQLALAVQALAVDAAVVGDVALRHPGRLVVDQGGRDELLDRGNLRQPGETEHGR